MGVHGLWDLLAPVGRRVSVETLAGKRLAIDASIWMIQFMKAMRDEKGEMLRNAHLIGFFRRICKLLFLRTKPVFVFDGGTPALKRRTVIARRRQRENAQAKIRKTAEKLLFNHVKAMKLKELASNNVHDQECNNMSEHKAKSDTLENNNQELIDELLAAEKLESELGEFGSEFNCAVEIGSSSGNASASATAFPDADEDDEEIILPITDGDVDPAVLASLPPSMQLDLLVQMRERLMAENRQKYQKVKKAPQKFSELQIEAYLKTVAFRREINQVQKAASGKGVGGVQTSRIASESNREYIFSSSFSGDKQLLAPGETENIPDKQLTAGKKDSSFDILNFMSSTNKSNKESGSDVEEVHTFLDERGLKRVSRRRAMGIRMTRDLERNIDLLKEVEQDRTTASNEPNVQFYSDMEINVGKSPRDGKSFEAVNEYNCDVEDSIVNSSLEPENNKGTSNSEACIKISFDDDGMQSCLDGDDEFFAHLVAGSQASNLDVYNSTSECDWEDGVLGGESGSSINVNKLGTHDAQDENKEDSDVEWEEGSSLIGDKSNTKSYDEEKSNGKKIVMEQLIGTYEKFSLLSSGVQNVTSKGFAEEEAALQEAIRRSLEDISGKKASNACHIELESESCSPIPSTQLERVSDEIQLSQSTNEECGKSNFKAGKDTYAPKPFGTHSSATASTADGPTPCIATKDHLEQQPGTIIERDENGNLGCGSSGLTNMAACISSNTIPKNLADDMTAVEAVPASIPRQVDEYSVGQSSSALERPTMHSVLETTAGKNDNFPGSVHERIHEDNTLEPLGSSLEDELLILDQEYKNLGDEQRKLERNADSVNAEMFVECQEMLQMFGLPYIIAPMEAEAQCAYMELANLVDGVVTDDSDVFLFGGQSVYKNIFDDRKYVETYLMKDIESELGLSREKLIRMALLLGSDYTEGVSGIGIVNAIEVVNAFPEEDGLRKFREWIESPDPAILDKIGAQQGLSVKKKASKASRKGMINSKSNMKDYSPAKSDTLLENEDNAGMNDISSTKLAFMNKHRNVSKNWHIPASFPSDAVISAYEAPQVDKSTEPFAWGKPDVFSLRRLCWEKFAWASQKADELLLPVLKEYNKHETQLRLEAFYTFNERFAKIRSKRIQKAVKGITGKKSFDEADDLVENSAKPNTEAYSSGNKKKKSLPKRKDNVGEKRNVAKKLKSQREMGNQKDGLSKEVGSKRVREGWRGKAVGRARQRDTSDFELNETSSSNYNTSDENEPEMLAENVDLSNTVRQSKRARKAVNYMEKDEESGVIPENSTDLKISEDVTDEQKSPHSPSAHEIDFVNACAERELPEQTLPGDYLMTGGGFCAEEDEETESNKLGAIQRDNATLDASSDYFQMGGGFCLDDKDDVAYQDPDGGEASSPTNPETQEVGQNLDSSVNVMVQASVICSGLEKGVASNSKLNSSEQHQETTDGTLSNVAQTNNDVARSSVNPFSAIPYLKRKRR